jgi:hypothetical protein
VNGTVTIALDDFKNLEKAANIGIEAKQAAESLDREVSLLLSFLMANIDMVKVAERYNLMNESKSKLEVREGECRLIRK